MAGRIDPAQMWFAEQLGLPVDGFETLDGFWRRWSESSEPVLSPELFEPSLRVNRKRIQEWLISESRRPFVVAADSTDEAKAFLACVFRDREIAPEAGRLGGRCRIGNDFAETGEIGGGVHSCRFHAGSRMRARHGISPTSLHRDSAAQCGRFNSKHRPGPA